MNELNPPCDIFCHIGRALTSSLNPNKVFRRVMELIGQYFHPHHWSLLLMDEETGRLKFEIVMGADESKLRGFYLEPNEGIVGWVCGHGEPVVAGDVRKDPRFSPKVDGILGFTTRSVVCVPITNGQNHIMGAIELVNKLDPDSKSDLFGRTSRKVEDQWSAFDETDLKILTAIASFTGVAVENAFLHSKVRELATIDSLTGLKNRLYFSEALQHEMDRVRRYQHTICLLMMDIDGLKSLNDQFGHLAGDEMIVAVADILKTAVRESDIVARIGGDEFVVIMPLADYSNGNELAKRIQALVSERNKKSKTPELKLGISIGIEEAGPKNVADLLSKADRKLYKDKMFRKSAKEITSENEIRRYLRDTLNGEGNA